MSAITSTPGAFRLFALSLIARLPETMFTVALLLHAQHLTGSFAAGGVVTGVYAMAEGVGGPLLGQLVDRHGQTVVLLASAFVSAVALLAITLLPVSTPVGVIVALAGATGLATPPVGACMRTLFGSVLPDSEAVQAAYAFDASASELAWLSGPPLALGLGVLWSTGVAVAVGGFVLLAATAAFALQPASRAWVPTERAQRARGGSLRAPAMRTLIVVLVGVGVLFGDVEVAITGAAESLGARGIAAPLLALWGAGSLFGGLAFARLGRGVHGLRDLVGLLAALTIGHAALAAATGSPYALGAVLFLAGASIAPTYTTVYAIVDRVALPGTLTEAFAWMTTAVAVGSAIGAAVAGALVDSAGPGAVFGLAGVAGALAMVIAAIGLSGRGDEFALQTQS